MIAFQSVNLLASKYGIDGRGVEGRLHLRKNMLGKSLYVNICLNTKLIRNAVIRRSFAEEDHHDQKIAALEAHQPEG
jgi:hypothetical protein